MELQQAQLPQALLGYTQETPIQDRFFEREPGMLATYDFDYEKVISFRQQQAWAMFAFFPPAWFSSICCMPCFINQNVEWKARAQHVCLTVDGIKYVDDRRKTCCGLSCTDKGKESKTVPYDKITDCDIREPAGMACCCCIPNVLSTVSVDTASSGKNAEGKHELDLSGLVDASAFKQAVWAMKRRQQATIGSADGGASGGAGLMQAPGQADMVVKLLGEIRDELKTMNAEQRKR